MAAKDPPGGHFAIFQTGPRLLDARRRKRPARAAFRAADPGAKKKSPPSPLKSGTKGKPSAVPPAFPRGARALQAPVTAGRAVPVSGAAPGRTKRSAPRRLSAGGRLSLGERISLFSRSSHLYKCNDAANDTYNTKRHGLQGGKWNGPGRPWGAQRRIGPAPVRKDGFPYLPRGPVPRAPVTP